MKCSLPVKLLGAVVVAVGAAGAAYGFGSVAVHPQTLARNVFVVDMSTLTAPPPSASSGAGLGAGTAPVAAVLPPIADLLMKADVAAGQRYAKTCSTCHSFGKGEAAKMGPNLYGIIGAKHAHMAGFAYSDAMKSLADKDWTPEELNRFLFKPSAHIPGTKMPFAGIKNDSDRANVIAWLRTLSDSP
jgi:cytochrome c